MLTEHILLSGRRLRAPPPLQPPVSGPSGDAPSLQSPGGIPGGALRFFSACAGAFPGFPDMLCGHAAGPMGPGAGWGGGTGLIVTSIGLSAQIAASMLVASRAEGRFETELPQRAPSGD